MKKALLAYFTIICLLLVVGRAGAQTFTYSPGNAGCNGTWGDADCWTVSATSGCTPNTAPPSTSPSGCEVNIVINDDLTYTGNLVFGGTFNQLSIGNGARFVVNGNVQVAQDRDVEFNLVGGSEMDINGELIVSLGSSGGTTMLHIDGDGDSYVYTDNIDLRGRAILTVEAGGALVSSGPTEYNGNSSRIDVHGFFRTATIDIQGGNNHQLNSYGSAEIIVEGNIVLGGTSGISFNGDSEVYVGGDIDNNNGAEIIASDNAKVYYCGTIKKPAKAFEYDFGDFEYGCRSLPVQWGEIGASIEEGKVVVSWATLAESESSHFEIERSVDGVEEFVMVGNVNAMGWSDQLTAYHFEDGELPVDARKVYYRIKQLSLGGAAVYSKVVRVDLPKIKTVKNVWQTYPNPAQGNEVKVALMNHEAYQGGEVKFRVFDSMNASEVVTVRDAHELNPKVAEVLQQFSSGLVVVEMSWQDKVEYLKLILR